ncbi:MAG: ABC transporter permease, partial [Vallitaleaceae bacterium]|nr:ABC transporter permease [Vallitaleaceae bacterium]
MKKLISLTKTLQKNTSLFALGSTKKSKLLIIVLLVSLLPMGILVAFITANAYDVLLTIEQEGIILAFGLGITSVLIFFFGIFHVLGTFYFANDIESLLYMPLSPYHILGSKMMLLLIYEYLTELIILTPILIIFGIKSSGGVLYILFALIVYLTLPLIALVIGSVLVMIIMRFTNFGQHKERLKFFGGIVALILALGFNFMLQKQMTALDNVDTLNNLLLQGNNTLIDTISKLFPGTIFAAKALADPYSLSSLVQLLLFLIVSFGLVLIFILLGQVLYFKGVLGMSEVSAKRKLISMDSMNKSTIRRSTQTAFIIKEFRTPLRSPIYFLNCILMAVLLPVIFIGVFVFAPTSDAELEMLMNLLTKSEGDAAKVAVIVGIMLMMASLNAITPSALSREGKGAYVMKYLPVPLGKIVHAKILTGVIVSIISSIIFSIGFIYMGLPINNVIIGFLLGLFGVYLISQTGIALDLLNPKLSWDNEQQAVKQNMNVLYNMIIMLLTAAGIIFFT